MRSFHAEDQLFFDLIFENGEWKAESRRWQIKELSSDYLVFGEDDDDENYLALFGQFRFDGSTITESLVEEVKEIWENGDRSYFIFETPLTLENLEELSYEGEDRSRNFFTQETI